MIPDLPNSSDMSNSDRGPEETPEERKGESFAPVMPAARPTGIHAIFLGPHEVRAGWRAAMYVALFFLFFIILQGFAALVFDQPFFVGGGINPGALFVQEVAAAVCAIAAALLMARIEGRRFGEYGMPWRGAFRGYFWKGALWGGGLITILVLLIRALGGYSFGGWALGASEAVEWGLVWAAVFVVVGVYEEFFFRGYLQFTAASGMGFWPAATLLSIIFGATHLANPGESAVGILNVVLVGIFFCLTLRRTGNLWFAIGFHTTWNFAQSYIFSVPNSGLVLPGQLLHASFEGPDWLTGGSAGPEGSILTCVVIAAAFVAFDRVYRQNRGGSPPPGFSVSVHSREL